MSSDKFDLLNQTFGNLTVLYKEPKEGYRKNIFWVCQCTCGNTTVVRTSHLLSGNTKSCGCLAKQSQKQWAEENTIHLEGTIVKSWEVKRKLNKKERLGVLCLSPNIKQTYWECCCVFCGTFAYFGGWALRRGSVGCCECQGGQLLWVTKVKNITNHIIGYTTIEALINPEIVVAHGMTTFGLKKSRWLGRCICGLGFEISYQQILKEQHDPNSCLSCGCMQHKRFEVGKLFGKWIILSESPQEKQPSKWLSQCICGYKRELTEQTLFLARKEEVKEHSIERHINNPRKKYNDIRSLIGVDLVYFIRENSGAVKIGFTHNIVRRLTDLQHTSPYELKILLLVRGDKGTEQEFHKSLNNNRLKGEWFLYNPTFEQFLQKVINDYEVLWCPAE